MTQRDSSATVRKKLLIAAAEIFADKGFRHATIAEICTRAGANIAAVNYHFGNKENLYKKSWRHAFLESLKDYPLDGGVGKDSPPEEQLFGQVRSLLMRVSDEKNKEFWFIQREMSNPTGLLEEVVEEVIKPLKERMSTIVREILSPQATEMEVFFCEISIMSQCLDPMIAGQRKMKQLEKAQGRSFKMIDIEAYSVHVTKFCLAGMRDIRKQIEKRTKSSKTNS